ncbi:hypothetical protein B0H10DRAFT_1025903 [Mycena sp. CBHHK59/15]|nr:hypothetical protein B0H10DRAFT_1025903 [Mycena sp. CBHHK59/15]
MDPRQRQLITEDGTLRPDAPVGGGGSSSRSRSPSPARERERERVQHPLPSHPQLIGADLTFQGPGQTLAPPPAAPHGPRSPAIAGAGISRTPSPGTPTPDAAVAELADGIGTLRVGGAGRGSLDDEGARERERDRDRDGYFDDEGVDERLMQPSAKALGKRKVVADPYDRSQPLDSDEMSLKDNFDDRPADSDEEDTPERLWQHIHHPVQHFVYDAAAERTQQRIREGHAHALMVNGVH